MSDDGDIPTARSPAARLHRWAVRTMLLFALLLAAAGLALAWFDTGPGRDWLVGQANRMLAGDGVRIGQAHGRLFGRLELDSVEMFDGAGTWLAFEEIRLDWRPAALFDGRLDVRRLTIARARLARLPDGGGEAEGADESRLPRLPSLPFDLDIGRLAIEEVEIAEPAFGVAARLTLAGQATLVASSRAGIELDIASMDGGNDRLSVALAYDEPAATLALEARLDSPPGGLFAAVLGARPDEAVGLRLSGEGPLNAWSGDISAHLGERVTLAADLRGEGTHLTLAGAARLVGILREPYAPLIGPDLALTLSVDIAETDRLPLALDLAFAAGRIALEGLFDTGTEALDLALDLAIEDGSSAESLVGGLQFARADIAGQVGGTLAAPSLVGTLRLDRPALTDGPAADALETKLSVALAEDRFDVELDGRIDRLAAADLPLLSPQFSLAARYGLQDGTLRLDRSRISAAGSILGGTGEFATRTGKLALAGRIETRDLSSLPFPTGLYGGAIAEITIERGDGDAAYLFGLDIAGEKLRTETEGLSVLLGPTPRVTASGRLAGSERLTLDMLQLEAAHARLDAEGDWHFGAQGLDMSYRLALEELGSLAGEGRVSLAGGIVIDGRISGPPDALVLAASGDLESVSAPGLTLVDLVFAASLEDLASTPSGEVRLDADSRYGAFHVGSAIGGAEDGTLRLSEILLTLGTAEISGNLTMLPGGLMRGRLRGTTGDLATLPESRRFGLRGDLALALILDAADGRQQFRAEASADKLIVPVGDTEILELDRLDLEVTATFLETAFPRLSGRLEIDDVRVGFSRLAHVDIAAESDGEALTLSGGAEGDWRGPLDLSGHLRLAGNESARTAALGFAGTLFGQTVTLEDEARMRFGTAGWHLEPLTLAVADGTLRAEGERSSDALRGRLRAENLPLDLVNVIAARLMPTGRLDAELELAQSAGSLPDVKAFFTLRGVEPALGAFVETPPFDAEAELRLASGIASLKARARTGEAMNAELSAEAPVALDLLAGTGAIDSDAPISGRLDWQGALAPLFMLADLPEHEAAGEVSAGIDISGSIGRPRMNGRVRIAEGRYEHLASGFLATNLLLEADLAGERLTLRRLEAEDGNGGRIEGEGWLALGPDASLETDVRLALDRVRVARRVDVRATTSGELRLEGGPAGLTISGAVRPDRVEIDIARPLPFDVATIDVIEIHTSGESAPDGDQPRRRGAREAGVELDATISAPRRIFVRGRGLDSEWSVDLAVKGSSSEPDIQGNARLIRGVLDFAGRRFEIDRGELLFTGGRKIDPLIQLSAQETVEGLAITISLSGPISAPALALSSSPTLPQEEILAHLLFGASMTDLSALEAVQLASAVASLSGGGGLDIVGAARSALGLDRLNVELDGENDAGARISGGKYLTDKVYFEVTTETGTGVTGGNLEWSLTKNLSVRSRVTSARENSIRLRWSWSY